jgi:hypothetical protein
MGAHSNIAYAGSVLCPEQTVSEEPLRICLLRRIEALLDRAFGEDEESVANSLRGF